MNKVITSIFAILSSFIIAFIICFAIGTSPLELLNAFFISIFSSPKTFGEYILTALPIILTGLSVGFAFKTGLFNIGAEGQVIIGSLAAALVGIFIKAPFFIHLPLALIAAAIAGGLWAVVPGLLKAKLKIHEVVTSIMMNYIALYLGNFIISSTPGFESDRTLEIYPTASLNSKWIENLTDGSRLGNSIFIVIISLIVYYIIIEKTSFGFKLKAIGSNKDAAKYAGMSVKSGIVSSMFIAGLFSGLAGAILVLDIFGFGRIIPSFENYGFDGIATALVGGSSAIGILLSGLLFAVLKVAQPLLQVAGFNEEIAIIISALVVFFIAISRVFDKPINAILSKKGGDK